MPTRFAVVGPGRVGSALARRWHEAGLTCIGFRGRSPGAAARAVQFCGAGQILDDDASGRQALGEAAVVLLAVQDRDLPAAVAQLAAAVAPRRCALFVHTSGFHDVAVLDPLAVLGARTGALHPACPLPDAASGYRELTGKPDVIQGTARAERLLRVLAEKASMRPYPLAAGVDRRLYHAACALAANGVTALFDLVTELFERGCRFGADPSVELATGLMGGALRESRERGARDALSGPVVRGDLDVVAAHLDALRGAPDARRSGAAYRALMARALDLAAARGALGPELAAELARLLAPGDRDRDGDADGGGGDG